MPHDYKRVLREHAEEEDRAVDTGGEPQVTGEREGGARRLAGPVDTRSPRIPEPASIPEPAGEAGA